MVGQDVVECRNGHMVLTLHQARENLLGIGRDGVLNLNAMFFEEALIPGCPNGQVKATAKTNDLKGA